MNPAFGPPDGKRLGGVNAEVIQIRVVPVRAESGLLKPILGKLIAAIGHVSSAEHAEPEHLLGRNLGTEVGMEAATRRSIQCIRVLALHEIVDFDAAA